MRKILFLFIVTFLLVGCGCSRDTSNVLKCNLENDDQKRNLTVNFKNNNKEVSDVIMEFSYVPDDISNAKKIIEEDCKKKEFKQCDITENGNVLTYIVSGNPERLGIDVSKSLDETKKILENDRYTCIID